MFGYGLLGASIGVGLAIAAMMLTDTVHPPAGANPIVVALTQPGVSFLVVPVLLGATLIVTVSRIYAAGVARIERR
jgi:CBS-domain-containing membrane protein